jgi:hypothetical protein
MRKAHLIGCLGAMAVMAVWFTTPVAAQHWRRDERWRGSTWGSANLSVLIAEPRGQFAQDVGTHGGLGASMTFGTGLGVRVSAAVLVYGHERQSVPLAGTGGRVYVNLDTDNIIGTLGIGPQITLGSGPVQLYGWGSLNFGYIATISSAEDDCGCDAFASTTNFDDATLAKEVGGGMLLRFGRGRSPVSLDLSVRYVDHGYARYLTEGGIYERFDGSLGMDVRQSQVEMVIYQLGLSFGLH